MPDDTSKRTRTIDWDDPRRVARNARKMSGSEFFDRMRRGEIPEPPFSRLLGLDVFDAEPGRFVMTFQPQEFHYNPMGCVHGGILATVLDSVMSASIHTALPQGRGYLTLEIKVNFVRPVFAVTGEVMAEGRLVSMGRQIATAEGKLTDTNGNLCASGSATCLILESGVNHPEL